MDPEVLEFVNTNHLSVLTVILPDGNPHSAVMHYSVLPNFPTFFFSTDITSLKCQGLKKNQPAKASIAIGFSEHLWQTLQLTGEIRLLTEADLADPGMVASIKAIHYSKNPTSAKYKDSPNTVFLEFIPSWWRYTDFSQKPPKIIENT